MITKADYMVEQEDGERFQLIPFWYLANALKEGDLSLLRRMLAASNPLGESEQPIRHSDSVHLPVALHNRHR